MSKKLINLLRHGSLPREEDGAIEFWRLKDYLQNYFVHSRHRSDEKWKSIMAKGGIVLILQEKFFTSEQCLDSGRFLQVHLSHWMCNQFTFHHQFRIDTGRQKLSKRQTVFFLPLNPMDKEHKDPETVGLEAPRRAQYMHTAWKKHQNTVCWVDIRLAQKKGLKFYQTRSNAIIFYKTLPACCIPKAIKIDTGEIKNEKIYESPRPPPKIFLRNG